MHIAGIPLDGFPFLAAAGTDFIQETVRGSTVVVSCRLRVPISIFAVAAIIAFLGFRFRKSGIGARLLILGSMLLLLMAPTLLLDRAVVDEAGMTLNSGIWSTRKHRFDYAELAGFQLMTGENRAYKGQREQYHYLIGEFRVGETVKVTVSDRISRTALPRFLRELKARNISLIDERIDLSGE